MTSLEEKVDFVKFILKYDLIEDMSTHYFFSKLMKKKSQLDKIAFSCGKTKLVFKYKITFNLRNNLFFFEMNGKKYNDKKLLRSIIRLIDIAKPYSICICIMDKSHVIKQQALKVSYQERLVTDIVTDAWIDYILSDYRKKKLMEKIDKALDNKDVNEFKKLCLEYNQYI